MAMAVIGLALYLMVLGKWGKGLKAKNAPLGLRRFYGFFAALPSIAAPFYYGYPDYASWLSLFMVVWCGIVAILAFITVVYAPKWIVGAPKPVANSTAK